MQPDLIQLTQDLIAIQSESRNSNADVADFLEPVLQQAGFAVERLTYIDEQGVEKINLVGKKGQGTDGLGFFTHSDTVPGNPDGWEPFSPSVQDGRIIGRGSCDMKGPIAAAIMACADIEAAALTHPLYLVVAADEEVGYKGALNIIDKSQTMKAAWPKYGIITEPTRLIPVYAHKGRTRVIVTAHGRAAHTSTGKGISANFLIAPFLAEMAELSARFQTDQRFMNHEFNPPTNGFNMVLNDGNCATNVTAAKTVCSLDIRIMPNDNHEEAAAIMTEKAKAYDLEVYTHTFDPFYISLDAEVIQAALAATGAAKAETVPFGTEAAVYKDFFQAIILAPGDIAHAHTVGESIGVAELTQGVDVYRRMIEGLCM